MKLDNQWQITVLGGWRDYNPVLRPVFCTCKGADAWSAQQKTHLFANNAVMKQKNDSFPSA